MRKAALVAVLSPLVACAPQPRPSYTSTYNPSYTSSYTPSSASTPATTAKSPKSVPTVAAVRTTPAQIETYRKATAETLRDPESARFRNLRVVKDSEGTLGLCGELNAKNGFGAYTGSEPFYAAIVPVGTKDAVAVLWSSNKVGYDTILEKCRLTA